MGATYLDGELPPSHRGARRRRRTARALIVTVLVAASAVATVALSRSWHRTSDDPRHVALPPVPADATATVDYLAGPDGAVVQAVLAASEDALSTPTLAGCQRAIAVLDSAGTPGAVFAAASAIPDPATSDMAVNDATVLARYLGECLTAGAPPDQDDLIFATTVLRRRLAEVS